MQRRHFSLALLAFASMPPLVQGQYVEMLLDYLDDETRGLNANSALVGLTYCEHNWEDAAIRQAVDYFSPNSGF